MLEVGELAGAAEVVVEFHVDIAHGFGLGLFGGGGEGFLHGGFGVLLQVFLGDLERIGGGGHLNGHDVARGLFRQGTIAAVTDVGDHDSLNG